MLEAAAEAETTSTEVKENLEAAAAAVAEPLLSTLTLKELMIIIRIVTYQYQLALVAPVAKAGADSPPEALEQILRQHLKLALVRQCVELHAWVAVVAPATLEMQQPIQLVALVAGLTPTLTVVNILPLYSF